MIPLPKIKARWAEKYELRDLKKEFSIPTFQRKASSPHIRGMVEAILAGKFYDIVIKYYVDLKSRKQIIDGQQRVEALWICHTQHNLQYYNLMFLIFEEQFARTVFRRLNMGKALVTRDHSKALDDGKNTFFNELNPWLTHDRSESKSTFVEMLNALNYAKNKRMKTVSIRSLDEVIDSITKEDLEVMKRFSEAAMRVAPVVYHSILYKAMIYRNAFRVAYDEKLKTEQITQLLRLCLSNKTFKENSGYRKIEDIQLGWKIIHDDLLPKVKQ